MDKKEDHIYIAIDLKSFYASVECPGAELKSTYHQSCCGRQGTNRKNHLPGSFPFFEGLWNTRKSETF